MVHLITCVQGCPSSRLLFHCFHAFQHLPLCPSLGINFINYRIHLMNQLNLTQVFLPTTSCWFTFSQLHQIHDRNKSHPGKFIYANVCVRKLNREKVYWTYKIEQLYYVLLEKMICVPKRNQERTPSKQEVALTAVGLGERTVKFENKQGNHTHIQEMLEKDENFPL